MSLTTKKLFLNSGISLLLLFLIVAAIQDSVWRIATKSPLDGSGIFSVCAMGILVVILSYLLVMRIRTLIQLLHK